MMECYPKKHRNIVESENWPVRSYPVGRLTENMKTDETESGRHVFQSTWLIESHKLCQFRTQEQYFLPWRAVKITFKNSPVGDSWLSLNYSGKRNTRRMKWNRYSFNAIDFAEPCSERRNCNCRAFNQVCFEFA